MIVVGQARGGFGNRLTLYAHVLAHAIDCGEPVLHADFTDYSRHLEHVEQGLYFDPRNNSWRRPASPAVHKYCKGTIRRLARSDWLETQRRGPIEVITAETPATWVNLDCLAERRRSRVVILNGYYFRAHGALRRHEQRVQSVLQIRKAHRDAALKVLGGARSNWDVVVGVHIRHGDYQTWQGGKYFFSLDEYVAMMHEFRERRSSERVGFVVCSNSEWTPGDFPELDVVIGPGHLASDLEALAQCDLIIGPPSSFSRWASFSGSTPLCAVERGTVDLSENGFSLEHSEPWVFDTDR
jgi:hypothetical protein